MRALQQRFVDVGLDIAGRIDISGILALVAAVLGVGALIAPGNPTWEYIVVVVVAVLATMVVLVVARRRGFRPSPGGNPRSSP